MLVEWSRRARKQVREIYEYIEERDPQAADKLLGLISEATLALSDSPYLFRRGRVADTREMIVHPNYIVVYRVTDRVTVLGVMHARRRYPIIGDDL